MEDAVFLDVNSYQNEHLEINNKETKRQVPTRHHHPKIRYRNNMTYQDPTTTQDSRNLSRFRLKSSHRDRRHEDRDSLDRTEPIQTASQDEQVPFKDHQRYDHFIQRHKRGKVASQSLFIF